ncbi:flap endonuclease 1-like [Limulus polyphemus]|uniref:Flap endonuclease 1 n=1 Tax=Limulus polyphemus TaxID=6850 RepID=A0ABM1SBP6_LIMPO|nr:flap endonuclease 1-like [Limulus polyphemus]XP_022241051.1 flap endonuclease 1-like [Limulus polyphemus]
MGIHGLAKLIADCAPSSVKENDIKNYFGRKIAIDASMSIYQFLIAVRQEANVLTNSEGETTSHLVGLFYRTIRMIENGIKPVYVFDGKPPQMKSSELEKRQERREEAQKQLEAAEEAGVSEDVDKFTRRLVKVTKQHNDDCKELLRLMGVPYVEAPCEAEAQCAALVKTGKVYATATEDMDGLTFGTNILLRHMTFSEARKMPIKEFHLQKVLNELDLNMDEFIDLCILLGCDYCESIRGIGPKRAIELIRQHRSIEEIIKHLDGKKYTTPSDWMFNEARKLFKEPEVADSEIPELKWNEPDEEGLVKFLCADKGFSEERVRNGVKKLIKGRHGSTQGRLDSFFKVIPSNSPVKRKANETKESGKKKSKTAGSNNKFRRPK